MQPGSTMLIPADAGRGGELRQARFHDLQPGRVSGQSPHDRHGSTTSVALRLEDRELVILGTEYAGEMKKGVFTVANYFAPKRGILSMRCSARAGADRR
jgi:ATP-dependent phosphoenolpyruvate carboxykinase